MLQVFLGGSKLAGVVFSKSSINCLECIISLVSPQASDKPNWVLNLSVKPNLVANLIIRGPYPLNAVLLVPNKMEGAVHFLSVLILFFLILFL